ncbi:MAG TPA: FimV/HubP family polar landmark protein [Steroidobacteraceae bacterium]|nr:FimV/HubP family polar landmark protein [Steroidobacteraceae bacterium]
MRSYLPRLVLTGALLSPATLFALGLGEIRLNSALNQPFDADIELIAPTADELASLKVGLANNDLFSRYGLERPAYLSGFDFSVSRARDGRATIKVSSNRSVTEPFVTLLVEANWGRGRILREYTVLLDPPVFMPSQPENQAPVTSPQSGTRNEGRIERAPTPAPESTPVPSPTEPARPVPAPETSRETPISSTAPAALGGSYTVERNDTLWRIASQVQPGASPRVVNQTMIALFRANPGAFDGNINRLKAGSVLRVPEQGDIETIPTSEASAEVNRQQQEWSGAPRTAAGDEPSRLRLVPPEETPTAPAPAAPVEAPVAGTRPGSTAPTTAAPDDRRLEVTSPELANAQQRATDAPVTPEPETTASTSTPEAQVPTAEQPAPQAEAAPATPPAAQPQRPRPTPAAQPQAEEPSLLDRLTAFWWIPVILGLLVVGVLAFLKRRRDQADVNDLPDANDAFSFEPRASRAASTVARDDDFDVPDDADHDDTQNFEVAPVVSRTKTRPVDIEPTFAPANTADDTLSSETSVRFDQQDALAEADFHMAYGLYDQAADLVKIAIEREPERRDLKLKLLEIYFVWGNKDLFLDTARDLNANREEGPAGEWDKVLIMGKQIAPDDPMFKGEAGGHVDLVDVNLEGGENRVDVDLFAEPGSDAREGLDLQFASGEHQGLSASNNSNLDFLLDDEKAPRGDDEPTREMDHLARTQETPTIESPAIDRRSTTLREKVDRAAMARGANTENTAELSLDDLGLDVDSLEATGSLEDTTSLMKDSRGAEISPLRDDEMTQLAPSLSSLDRTMEAPRRVETFDIESTGTIYVDQVDLAGGDTVEQRRPDVDSTASFARPHEIDVDFDNLDAPSEESNQTIRHPTRGEGDATRFSDDVFTTDSTASMQKIDLDVGEPLGADDREPTNKVVTTEMELSELEPVTMSEVGTKLDLARAYMDMGDPDGARSILEEVVAEGSSSQKQEAQRLLDSIR